MFSIYKNNLKKILIISLGLFLCSSYSLAYAQETSSTKKELNKTGVNNSSSSVTDSVSNSINNSMESIVDDVVDKANPQNSIPEYKEGDDLLTPDDFLHKENVTIKDIGNKIEKRMFEVISLLQTFVKPFAIIMFIISAINVVVGIVFNTKKHALGYLGLIFSVFMYVGVIYAPNLVGFFANWLSF